MYMLVFFTILQQITKQKGVVICC